MILPWEACDFGNFWAKIGQFLPILIPKTYLFSIPVFGFELNTGIPVLGFGIGSFMLEYVLYLSLWLPLAQTLVPIELNLGFLVYPFACCDVIQCSSSDKRLCDSTKLHFRSIKWFLINPLTNGFIFVTFDMGIWTRNIPDTYHTM